jgi:hypothetical protein
MHKVKLMLACLYVSLFTASCERDNISGDVVINGKMHVFLYVASHDTLEINGSPCILETSLYRDFFPGVYAHRNHSLIASVSIVNTDSMAISKRTVFRRLFVIHDEKIWISVPRNDPSTIQEVFKLGKLSTDGPEWGPDEYVDVVAELGEDNTSPSHFLIARNQKIIRIE